MTISKSPPNILWVQVWVLAGVQGAISLTWLIYNLYLPQLLTQFGFPASLAAGLLVVENAFGVVLEPLMGGLSDQTKRWLGTSFPFISAGVILASALFIAIPCIVTFIPPTEVIRGILPVTLVAWALAMTIFRSPAIALLGRYATPKELPLAASLVTLAAGMIGAVKPIADKFVLGLGPIFCFAIASGVLLGAVAILRFFHPPATPTDEHQATTAKLPVPELSLILATGFSIAWGTRLLFDTLGKVLKSQFATDDISVMMVWIGLSLAFAALPAGFCATKLGNRQAMLSGVGATTLGIVGLIYMRAQIPIIFTIVSGFSLIVNGVIPFVLGLMPPKWAGLGIGIYFGGFSLAMSVFGMLFSPKIPPVVAGMAGVAAFLVAGGLILVSGKLATQKDAGV
jgi:hypothetical protein